MQESLDGRGRSCRCTSSTTGRLRRHAVSVAVRLLMIRLGTHLRDHTKLVKKPPHQSESSSPIYMVVGIQLAGPEGYRRSRPWLMRKVADGANSRIIWVRFVLRTHSDRDRWTPIHEPSRTPVACTIFVFITMHRKGGAVSSLSLRLAPHGVTLYGVTLYSRTCLTEPISLHDYRCN